MSQLIIGLTGGIASGKTTVSDTFSEHNVDIVDADIVAREAVSIGSKALQEIVTHFGSKILLPTGELNRRQLRDIIFSNELEKKWLNSLLHPLIRETIATQLQNCSTPYCILVAPLLIENKMEALVDKILVIDVEEETQIQRTMARDNCSYQQAKAILSAQITRKDRLIAADDIIHNNGMIDELTNDIKKLHDKYSKIAQEGS